MTLEHIGTTGSIVTSVNDIILDPDMKLDIYPWLEPSLWLLGGATSNAGGALVWASKAFRDPESVSTQNDLLLSHRVVPHLDSPLVFLPYLSGERCPIWNPRARGAFLGLSLQHAHDDVVQAVFEGVAFSLRHLLEYIQKAGGNPIDIICGDAVDSDAWIQLRADIYGRDLLVLKGGDPTSLGAMLLAGVGIGLFSDIRDAAQKTVVVGRTVSPSPENVEGYDELYALYRTAASDLQPSSPSSQGTNSRDEDAYYRI